MSAVVERERQTPKGLVVQTKVFGQGGAQEYILENGRGIVVRGEPAAI